MTAIAARSVINFYKGDILKLKEIAAKFSLFVIRFAILRRILDADMKDGTRTGIGLKAKQKEKEPVSL